MKRIGAKNQRSAIVNTFFLNIIVHSINQLSKQPTTMMSIMASSSSSSSSSTDVPPTRLPQQHQVPTLDLHGCNKPQAIRKLTDFLESSASASSKSGKSAKRKWVCVITGSGSHSQQGPVLRDAVHALLEKRQMEYQLNPKGRGSFVVNVQSGIVLYGTTSSQQQSTKLVLANEAPGAHVKLVGRPAPSAALIHDGSTVRDPNDTTLMDYPLLPKQQPKTTDRPLFEVHRHAKVDRAERHDLKRMLSDSALEYERHVQLKTDEDERLVQAVEQSKLETETSQAEERVFQELLAASAAEIQHQEEEEERQLQEILAKSVGDVAAYNDTDDDRLSLEAALQMSLLETATRYEELNMDDEEEDALRLALEQSTFEV
jgi:hypothetical protein